MNIQRKTHGWGQSDGRPFRNLFGRDPTHRIMSHNRPTLQFQGGVGNAISWIMEKIDANKAVELFTTDVMGMVLPRTGIEWKKRGPDAGRETLIREIAGTVFNIFLVGWLGNFALKFFNNRSAWLNPKGIHTGAWINAKTMAALGDVFKGALAEGKSPLDVRDRFIRKALDHLQASDPYTLSAITHALSSVDEPLQKKVEQALQEGPMNGKLSPEQRKKLFELLEHRNNSLSGTTNIERYVAQVRQQLLANPEYAQLSKLKLDKWLAQERLAISQRFIGNRTESLFLDKLHQEALAGGLSNEVSLVNEKGQVLLNQRALKDTLREIKHFLEHYVDRVLASPETGDITTKIFDKAQEKEAILEHLFGKTSSGWLSKLKRFIPILPQLEEKLQDGLIPYTYRSKWLLTFLPIVLTIGVSVSIAYVNNWITRKKHGGEVFFPGEGGPKGKQEPFQKHPNIYFNPLEGYPRLMATGSPFEIFQRQRLSLKGGA